MKCPSCKCKSVSFYNAVKGSFKCDSCDKYVVLTLSTKKILTIGLIALVFKAFILPLKVGSVTFDVPTILLTVLTIIFSFRLTSVE